MTLVLVLGVHAASIQESDYQIVSIGTGWAASWQSMNDRADVVGEVWLGLDPHPLLWSDGQAQLLPDTHGRGGYAYDINNAGDVVGSSITSPLGQPIHQAPVLWRGDELIVLELPYPDSTGMAGRINDLGWIVGYATPDPTSGHHAMLWRDGTVYDLGTLGGSYGGVGDLNNRGQVVGSSMTSAEQSHAFLWEEGAMRDLGTLGGKESCANAINEHGQVVGWAWTAEREIHAFVWEDGVMTDLGTLGGWWSEARSINDDGLVVGWSYTGGSPHIGVPMWKKEAGRWVIHAMWNGRGDGGGEDINNLGQILGVERDLGPVIATPLPRVTRMDRDGSDRLAISFSAAPLSASTVYSLETAPHPVGPWDLVPGLVPEGAGGLYRFGGIALSEGRQMFYRVTELIPWAP